MPQLHYFCKKVTEKQNTKMKVAVFCSASESIDPMYFERTAELGAWMGSEGMTLVYGGSDQGLMECLAREVKKNGGRVFGVVPTLVEQRGHVSECLDVHFPVVNLSDRKDTMMEEADRVVALPGGIGTLDEVFHVMAATAIGYQRKKVIFYNIEGFYDELIALLQELEKKGFCRNVAQKFLVARTLEELKGLLRE